MGFSLSDLFYSIPLFYPHRDPLGVVPGPKIESIVESNK